MQSVTPAPHVDDSQHLRERAAKMRASSKELKDNNTAAIIQRLAELYDRPIVLRLAAMVSCC